jgi:hypothetical protein
MTIERIAIATLGALFVLLGGCSFSGKDSAAELDTRAVERWNYLIAHQAEKAYDYLSPGTRETQTREAYAAAMNNRPVKWVSAKFNRKECDADRCTVYIDVSYSVGMLGAGGIGKAVQSASTQSETWVHVKDGWFFLPK